MKQERQGLQYTSDTNIEWDDEFPKKIEQKKLLCLATIFEAPKKTSYTDQICCFPQQSSRGNQYIFVLYDYDSNALLFETITDRTGDSITTAWKKCHKRLTNNGHKTNLYILDNEMSPEMEHSFNKAEGKYQKVPPGIHRVLATERGIIQTKDHLLSGYPTCDPEFSIRERDRLLPQAELTINL